MLGLLCTNPFKSPHSLSEVHHFSVVSWIHPKLKKLIGSVRNKIKSSFSYQQCLFFFYFILFNFTILYWFCHISKWICHRYTCIPHPELSSLLPPHTTQAFKNCSECAGVVGLWWYWQDFDSVCYTLQQKWILSCLYTCLPTLSKLLGFMFYSLLIYFLIFLEYIFKELLRKWYTCAKSLQSYLTLCDPMDHSPPGSSVHEILQARILEWVAMPSSRASSWPRNRTHVSSVSCIVRRVLYHYCHPQGAA